MSSSSIPNHVAIIMDGNGRWAERQGLPRVEGHRRGADAVRAAIEGAIESGVKYLTLYCFSTENWKRPKVELDFLMRLLQTYLQNESKELVKQSIRLNTIGRLNELSPQIQKQLQHAMATTVGGERLVLTLAINYGARQELVDAFRSMAAKVAAGELASDQIDEATISDHLYTRDIPDPDLLIRTSGEFRLSNYLLWQLSYAEFCILDTHWPEFTKTDFIAAVQEYGGRHRRFGGLSQPTT